VRKVHPPTFTNLSGTSCIRKKPNEKSKFTKYAKKTEEERKMKSLSEICKDLANCSRDRAHKGRFGRNE
jgi:hypothetical protein